MSRVQISGGSWLAGKRQRKFFLSLLMGLDPVMVMNSDAGHHRNFQLRALRVVTQRFPAADDGIAGHAQSPNYALRRNWLPSSGRQETGCALRSQLANS